MDPSLANRNLDPPKERVLSRGLLPALVVNLVLMSTLALGVDWRFGGDPVAPQTESRAPSLPDANDTARMGGAPTPPSEAPVPAWPTAAATGTVARQPAEPAAAVKPAPPPAPAVQVAKAEPRAKPVEKPVERRGQPSFDCSKARSPTERLICADPDLARLDRDLGRVHAQAKRATPDPLDFKRENDDEWQLREAVCRDRDCLLEWYAHRRQQLVERMAQGR